MELECKLDDFPLHLRHPFRMIRALAHVCLLSTDLSRTLDFYIGTLGLQKQFDFYRQDAWIGFYLKVAERQFIEIFLDGTLPVDSPKGRLTHFCLEVDDIREMHARLIARGVSVSAPKLGADQSWQIWTKDPDGVDIEFHQYSPQSLQFTGEKCLVNW